MFKSKRKEKPKRGSRITHIILLLILILLVAGGAVGYWFYNTHVVIVEPPVGSLGDGESSIDWQGNSSCSYSQGFGSRENPELATQLDTALRDAGTGIKMVTVEENLAEYRTCGDVIEPIYQTCSLLTIHLPIESREPSERELGEHIAEILDVLIGQGVCRPVELSVIFETPSGSITWQMSYAQALEAYNDGMRGGELYNPTAGR